MSERATAVVSSDTKRGADGSSCRAVVVKFRQPGDLAAIDSGDLELAPRDRVVVKTSRGEAIATVLTRPADTDSNDIAGRVLRTASPEDEQLRERNHTREAEAFRFCKDRIRAMHLGMKLVGVELALSGDRATFFFTSPQRVDFRALVKDLARRFHTRIEMRQIGVRDAARFTGGIGVCGRELCCATWLGGFEPVSIRMAKDQQLALNHEKLSGSCGRLRCCLRFEHQQYRHASTGLPRIGKRVETPQGQGRVRDIDVLGRRIGVILNDGSMVVLPATDVTPQSPPQRPPRPADADGSAAPSPGEGQQTAEASDGAFPAPRKRRRRRRRKRGDSAPSGNGPSGDDGG